MYPVAAVNGWVDRPVLLEGIIEAGAAAATAPVLLKSVDGTAHTQEESLRDRELQLHYWMPIVLKKAVY